MEDGDRGVELDQRVEGRDPDLGDLGGVGEQSEHDGFDELGLVDSSIGDTPQGQKAGHNGNFLLSDTSFDQGDQFTEDLLSGQNACRLNQIESHHFKKLEKSFMNLHSKIPYNAHWLGKNYYVH